MEFFINSSLRNIEQKLALFSMVNLSLLYSVFIIQVKLFTKHTSGTVQQESLSSKMLDNFLASAPQQEEFYYYVLSSYLFKFILRCSSMKLKLQ